MITAPGGGFVISLDNDFYGVYLQVKGGGEGLVGEAVVHSDQATPDSTGGYTTSVATARLKAERVACPAA